MRANNKAAALIPLLIHCLPTLDQYGSAWISLDQAFVRRTPLTCTHDECYMSVVLANTVAR